VYADIKKCTQWTTLKLTHLRLYDVPLICFDLYMTVIKETSTKEWHIMVRMCICAVSRQTYLLTPWSRVLLEKLTGSAARQEMSRVFGTRTFLTVFTSARHLSLSWTNSIQSPQPPPTSWRSILILSYHLRLGLCVTRFTDFITAFFTFKMEYSSTIFA
jgi:hypothetical protein